MIKVFFDASVIFSAIYSSSGASAKIISLIKSGYILGITTQTVVEELESNIHKIKGLKIGDVHEYISENNILVRQAITQTEIELYKGTVDEKDIHVLVGAILSNCDYLLTLDKKHLDNPKIKRQVRKVMIISPGNLLKTIAK